MGPWRRLTPLAHRATALRAVLLERLEDENRVEYEKRVILLRRNNERIPTTNDEVRNPKLEDEAASCQLHVMVDFEGV